MSRVYITGVAGFIGSHLALMALNQGHEVYGIDDLSGRYKKEYYIHSLRLLNADKGFTFRKGSILNLLSLQEDMEWFSPDYVIHCAARTSVRQSILYPGEYDEINVGGTRHVIKAMVTKAKHSKLIYFSSSSVYGKQKQTSLHEKMIPHPLSPYGMSKQRAETIVKSDCANNGIYTTIIRPFSVYGARGRSDMMPIMVLCAMVTGKPIIQYGNNNNNRRDWTSIVDLVYFVSSLLCKQSWKERCAIVNIGNGQPVGIQTLLSLIFQKASVYGYSAPKIVKNEVKRFEPNITKANISLATKLYGFKPSVNIVDGLDFVVDSFMKHKEIYI